MFIQTQHPARLIDLAARILLGAVFIYASWDKILDPAGFAQSIANYQILPLRWVNLTALLLPWLELTCGLCLITGWLVRGSALLVVICILIFMAALASSIVRGLDIQCGCFSTEPGGSGNLYVDMARDLVLLGMAVAVLLHSARPLRTRPSTQLPARPGSRRS